MIYATSSPVPRDQQPIEEYKQLQKSWFFSWPIDGSSTLYKNLIYSWIIILPLIILISSGSIQLKESISRLIIVSLTASFPIPIILLVRQWLSWKYIYKRLISEKIEYEESGWYDGQTWEKPIEWREKDILVAQHDIKPILELINKATRINILIILISMVIYINPVR